jgi:hypothetical protein
VAEGFYSKKFFFGKAPLGSLTLLAHFWAVGTHFFNQNNEKIYEKLVIKVKSQIKVMICNFFGNLEKVKVMTLT